MVLLRDDNDFGGKDSAFVPKYRAVLFGIPAYLVLYAVLWLGWSLSKEFDTELYQRVVQQKEYALFK